MLSVLKKYAILPIVSVVAVSCDPTYSIEIANKNSDTVTITAETTIHFWTEDTLLDYKELGGPYGHRIIRFKMEPGRTINCGMVIAGIDNQLPFTKIEIYTKKDSVIARSENQVLDMFEKGFWGSLKKPYCLTIE